MKGALGSVLLTDLYQLTMLDAYRQTGMNGTAVFEMFVRRLPASRGFLMAAGLEQALDYLESLRFEETELEWLAGCGHFDREFVDWLADLRFEGDVWAMREGEVFFANEPILRVEAPIAQAQLVESRLINILHFQSLIATKAARVVMAAGGRTLVDFGMRRAHGAEAAVWAARASYGAGFDGSATVEAGRQFGLPIFGTMAHSYVQAHDSEEKAFLDFARSRPDGLVLLIDTYDVEAAVAKVVRLADSLQEEDISIRAVRLDSGDLAAGSRLIRRRLDEAGHREIGIFLSGNLDEHQVADLVAMFRSPVSESARAWTCRRMRRLWISHTNCRSMTASPAARDPRARPPGPAGNRCSGPSPPTGRSRRTGSVPPQRRHRGSRSWPRS